MIDREINPSGNYSRLILKKGIKNQLQLLDYINELPYGRNSSRADLSLVIKEEKGTCSSKHALVKGIALEQNWQEVKLILALFKMTERKTPGIGSHIDEAGLDYIPEAHCFLNVNKQDIDLTLPGTKCMDKEIVQRVEILPVQVIDFKVSYHKKYIDQWIAAEHIGLSFDQVWDVREECIRSLSQNELI